MRKKMNMYIIIPLILIIIIFAIMSFRFNCYLIKNVIQVLGK